MLENISAAIIVDQQTAGRQLALDRGDGDRHGPDAESAVFQAGRAASARTRLLLVQTIHAACARTARRRPGRGKDMAAVVDESKSLNQGALIAKGFDVDSWWWSIYARSACSISILSRFANTPPRNAQPVDLDDGRKIKVDKINLIIWVLVAQAQAVAGRRIRRLCNRMSGANMIASSSRARSAPACKGARIKAEALASRIAGKNIAELSSMQVSHLARAGALHQGAPRLDRCWRPLRRAGKPGHYRAWAI